MAKKEEKIRFQAEVRAVKTMVDGSINVTLNLPEYCKEQGKKFIDWHSLMVDMTAEVDPYTLQG